MGADTPVDITQSLGGVYTVRSPQGLFRVDACDADALGFAVPESAKPGDSDEPATEPEVWEALKQVYDPEIPVNVLDLGLIYDIQVNEDQVYVKMTLTAPGCGMGPYIAQNAEWRIAEIEGVGEIEVDMVFDPPWNPEMITEDGKKLLGID